MLRTLKSDQHKETDGKFNDSGAIQTTEATCTVHVYTCIL